MRADGAGNLSRTPAVSLAVAKRHGANAVTVADAALRRLELLRGKLVPEGVVVEVTRNYGETARAKADELLTQLLAATVTPVANLPRMRRCSLGSSATGNSF